MKHIFTIMLSLLFIIACDDMSVTTSTGEHASSSSSTSSSYVKSLYVNEKSIPIGN